jgi:hypothetical protein
MGDLPELGGATRKEVTMLDQTVSGLVRLVAEDRRIAEASAGGANSSTGGCWHQKRLT